MQLKRTMEIDSLEQMCELMCGSVEEDYDDAEGEDNMRGDYDRYSTCAWYTLECESRDCCGCDLNEEEYVDEHKDNRSRDAKDSTDGTD